MKNDIKVTLNQLKKAFQEEPISSYLNIGLNLKKINSLFEQVQISPTEELIKLYSWHNGVNYYGIPSDKVSFTGFGVFYSLEDSCVVYQNCVESGFFDKDFFPIFCDDELLIRLSANSKDFGQIFLYSPSLTINSPIKIYDSLNSLFITVLKCFQEGYYWYNEEGFFSIDYENEQILSKKLNPNSEYWDRPLA